MALFQEACEALLAALDGVGGFAGQSSLRTWLTSILKFKIIDFQRRIVSERTHFAAAPEGDDSADPEWMERMYDETGHWNPRLGAWASIPMTFVRKKASVRPIVG